MQLILISLALSSPTHPDLLPEGRRKRKRNGERIKVRGTQVPT
jgi:hypothetical protein